MNLHYKILYLNNDIYARQKIFAESFVEPQHRMGIFTTYSANRYHSGQSNESLFMYIDDLKRDGSNNYVCF